ncbi:MAG: hypothetical protein HQL03_05780 [Nitrospirae bacterium]|nr:hypothetical protein [Nitrospirota bacterium]
MLKLAANSEICPRGSMNNEDAARKKKHKTNSNRCLFILFLIPGFRLTMNIDIVKSARI